MGVTALTFLDASSFRGPRRLLEFAIWKNAVLTLEPKYQKLIESVRSRTPDKPK
jgi:hypothetical protein